MGIGLEIQGRQVSHYARGAGYHVCVPAGSTHSSTRGLRPPEQLERPAGFPSSDKRRPDLPAASHGQRSLVGCRLWGCTESDTTEAT